MGLAESLSRVSAPTQTYCTVGKILKTLPEDEHTALVNAIDSSMKTDEIVRALQMNGYKISGNTIRDHRKKLCACYWENK